MKVGRYSGNTFNIGVLATRASRNNHEKVTECITAKGRGTLVPWAALPSPIAIMALPRGGSHAQTVGPGADSRYQVCIRREEIRLPCAHMAIVSPRRWRAVPGQGPVHPESGLVASHFIQCGSKSPAAMRRPAYPDRQQTLFHVDGTQNSDDSPRPQHHESRVIPTPLLTVAIVGCLVFDVKLSNPFAPIGVSPQSPIGLEAVSMASTRGLTGIGCFNHVQSFRPQKRNCFP